MEFKEPIKLNIGSGYDKREGYVNIDINKTTNPDIVVDLEKGKLPFKDNSVDEIIANMVLEHIVNLEPLINEIHRVMKKGAVLKIVVPYINSQLSIDHVRIFDDLYFKSWDKEWYESKEGVGTHQYTFNFKTRVLEVRGKRIGMLINKHTWHRFWQCLLAEMYVELIKQ